MFDEEYERFGFAPSGTQTSAVYHNPGDTGRPALVRSRLSTRRTHRLVLRAPASGVALDALGVTR